MVEVAGGGATVVSGPMLVDFESDLSSWDVVRHLPYRLALTIDPVARRSTASVQPASFWHVELASTLAATALSPLSTRTGDVFLFAAGDQWLLGDLTSGSQLTGTGPEIFELRLWEVSRAELGVSYALANEAAVTVGTPNFLGQVNLPVPGSGHGLNLVAGSGVGALSIPISLATRRR